MEQIITRHIQNVAGHYKGLCYAWDVVNEAMEDDGTYRQNPCKSIVEALAIINSQMLIRGG